MTAAVFPSSRCCCPGRLWPTSPTPLSSSRTRVSTSCARTGKAKAQFVREAATYPRQAVKPAMGEDMRRVIVQDEALRQRKDYAGAAELFRQAVERDPVAYPAAYFNLALLYGQQRRYARAIASMRKYLLLEPHASDARAAQDKIYEWEMLAGQN